MKILLYANDDFSDPSGIVRYVDYMADSLRRQGHEALIVAYARAGRSGLTSPAVLIPFKRHAIAKLRTAFDALARAIRERFPVVALTQLAAPLNAPLALALRVFGKKLLYVCMDPPPETYPIVFPNSKMARIAVPMLRFTETVVDRCSAATFTVSPGVERVMRARGWRGPIRMFYNVHGTAVAPAFDGPAAPIEPAWGDDPVVVYVGHLQPGFRGIEEQLEGVAAARSRGARVRLLLVGRGDTGFILARAAELGISDAVRTLPTVTPQELSALLCRCDAAVFASVSFALPSKVFEYLAHGLRVFAIDGPTDVNELLGELVERYPRTPGGLASALAGLRRRSNEEKRIAAQAAAQRLADLREQSVDALLTEVSRLEPRRAG